MPLTAGSNLSFSPGSVCDLVFADTALAAGSFGNWAGPVGGWIGFAAAPIFDVRRYKVVQMTLACTAITGTTPTAKLLVATLDGSDAGAVGGVELCATSTLGAGGGVQDLVFGAPSTAAINLAVGGSGALVQTPHRLRFFKIGIEGGGTPTGFTNGRLHIWGYR